jgi:hypothetical protein
MNMMNPLQQAFDEKKIDDQAFHSICWFFTQIFIEKFKGSWILKHSCLGLGIHVCCL